MRASETGEDNPEQQAHADMWGAIVSLRKYRIEGRAQPDGLRAK